MFAEPNHRTEAASGARLSRRRFVIVATIALLLAALLNVTATRGADDDLLLYPLSAVNYARVLRVTGLAEPGQRVRIEVDGVVAGKTVANASGDFVFLIAPSRGEHLVQAVEDAKHPYPVRSVAFRVRHDPPPEREAARARPAAASGAVAAATGAPAIDPPAATSTTNPATITGTAAAGAEVSVFVNGRYARKFLATTGGTFSAWVPLEDGPNSIYAIADDGSGASPVSNTVEIAYTNSLPRSYGATTISTPTVWTVGDGTPYTLSGDMVISATGALWVQPGVTLQVSGNYKIKVEANGEVALRGTAAARVRLRPTTTACTDATPRRSDWLGIEVLGGVPVNALGRASVEYADIYCANNGVYFNGGTGSLRDSRFLNNVSGIKTRAATAAALIAPLIAGGNTMQGNTHGVSVDINSRPSITGGNLITGNTYGIVVTGGNVGQDPLPVVNGNSLYGNSTNNYYAQSFGNPTGIVLDARGNWWGTGDPTAIAVTIRDRKVSTSAPYVDFSGYLGSAGGAPASTDSPLVGPINADATLAAGDYLMIGDVTVPSGVTWTLAPGATIRSVGGRRIRVSGTLRALGNTSQHVHFTSANPYPAKGDWYGIEVMANAVAQIDRARIEYAVAGVDFNGGQGTVSQSLIRFCTYGIYAQAGGNPTIHQGNQISHNDYGIYAYAGQPVVNGNALFSNALYNYYTRGFSAPKPTLDAIGNWWGVATEAGIAATIYTAGTSSTTVNTSGYLLSEPFAPAMLLSGFSMSRQQVRPLIAALPAEGVFTLNRGGSVAYRVVRDADGAIVRQWTRAYADPGQYAFQWDGLNDQGTSAAGGLHRVILTATDGLDPYVFDLKMPTTVVVPSGSLSGGFNPYLNEFYKAQLSYSQSSLASLLVTPLGGTPFYAFEGVHYPAGSHWVHWNGRTPDGSLVTATTATFATDAQVMRANGIYVFEPAVSITGTGTAPNIEVKSNPYLVTHSFDQASSIVYRIDADAVVRVVMLPPGIVDPAHASAIVLLNDVAQNARDSSGLPVDHTVVWRGFNESDPNGVLVASDGAYTFVIEATLPATGRKTVYRGVLSMVQ
ncbi:hypothetical protein LVB77_01360 [Lysobacter sp. 5GHs7-4]|uniref:FlgD immunoglobulin-like domain containing protein n=1 Tax=Lysobacter sp. 5GHs7-4 TaxID=2904253 RepID=UPI001E37BCF7|nr:FlgD immunoglobulin-like domain containing protein [Lysobacter sp. 5GHs7-4]UHQ23390.1 hypothetical protein LVB77_01360 [Lysobacter sp. 5GHs7-4]